MVRILERNVSYRGDKFVKLATFKNLCSKPKKIFV